MKLNNLQEEQLLDQANLLKHVSDAIIATGMDFRITSWNPAAETIYGWKADETIGQPIASLLQTQYPYAQQEQEVLRQLLTQGIWQGEVIQKHKDGSSLKIMASVSLIKDSAGQAVGAVAVNRDITGRNRAEEALRHSEERLRLLIESATDYAIFTADPTGVINSWNTGAERIFGWTETEAVGQPDALIFTPEDRAAGAPQREMEIARDRGRAPDERFHLRKDGSRFYVSGSLFPLYRDGTLEGYVKIARDLTERKQAEEALRRSEARLQQAISIETVGIIFFKPEGAITESNDAFLRMSGYSREALQAGELTWDAMTPPEFMPQSLQAIEEFKTFGQTTPYEKQYIRQDGSRWWGVFAAKRLDEAEGVEFIIDITKRKQIEEALRASEERLRMLIESVQDYAIYTIDPIGRVTSWNEGARRLKGYRAEEIMGQPLQRFYTPEDVAAGKPELEMRMALALGRAEDENWRVRKDGSRFWGNEIMTPLRADDGRLLGFTKITQDLTERKQTEEDLEERVRERTRQLHESEAQLRQMASRLTMAEQEERHRLSQLLHDDLQQLLYGIQLRLDFVNEGLQSGQGEDLLAHAQEVATWIEDAITTTRRLTVDLSPPVLKGEGLTEALEWLAPQMAETHGLQVQLEAEHRFLTEEEDMRVLLFQVIRELLFNVVKHAKTDQARVTLRKAAGQLVIQVSDEGRGFEPAGLGIDPKKGFGLSNIQERLGLFGGRLEILSRPGEGTQVTVTIPIKQKKR